MFSQPNWEGGIYKQQIGWYIEFRVWGDRQGQGKTTITLEGEGIKKGRAEEDK